MTPDELTLFISAVSAILFLFILTSIVSTIVAFFNERMKLRAIRKRDERIAKKAWERYEKNRL